MSPKKSSSCGALYIAIGKLTNIEGDPDGGKSTLSLQIAAAVSQGGVLHDQKMVKGKVLLLSAEDGLADTVRPRLDRAGANCQNVIALDKHFSFDVEGLVFLTGPLVRSALIS